MNKLFTIDNEDVQPAHAYMHSAPPGPDTAELFTNEEPLMNTYTLKEPPVKESEPVPVPVPEPVRSRSPINNAPPPHTSPEDEGGDNDQDARLSTNSQPSISTATSTEDEEDDDEVDANGPTTANAEPPDDEKPSNEDQRTDNIDTSRTSTARTPSERAQSVASNNTCDKDTDDARSTRKHAPKEEEEFQDATLTSQEMRTTSSSVAKPSINKEPSGPRSNDQGGNV
jgi:hypothetical protein